MGAALIGPALGLLGGVVSGGTNLLGDFLEARRRDQRLDEALNLFGQASDIRSLGIQAGSRDILRGFREREQLLEGAGQVQARDITQQFRQLGRSQQQSITSRGLAGTSVLQGARRGTAVQKRTALARLNDQIRQQQLGIRGEQLGFQERAQALDFENRIPPELFLALGAL